MKIEVNATRMELLKLKKRIKIARHGHKLLKDKQDELMRRFMSLIDKNKRLRKEIDKKLAEFYNYYYVASAPFSNDELKGMLVSSGININIKKTESIVMNLSLAEFSYDIDGSFNFGDMINGALDISIAGKKLTSLIADILELAEVENSVRLLAEEIEKTRRRVNALEYILIPELEQAIKGITMKLAENERSTLSRLMKVKEIVEAH